MKTIISKIIMLLASGVCFFFVVTGVTSMVQDFAMYNLYQETVERYKKSAENYEKQAEMYSSISSSYYSGRADSVKENLKQAEAQAGIPLRNAFSAILLMLIGAAGIVLGVFYFLGKNIANLFGWIIAGVTSAGAIAFLIHAIIAVADKKTASFITLETVESSPYNALVIIYGILFVILLGAQFLAIFFAKQGDEPAIAAAPATPVAAPTPVAPVAPTETTPAATPIAPAAPAPVPAPEAPVAPAPETAAPAPVAPAAPVETPSADQGAPTAA